MEWMYWNCVALNGLSVLEPKLCLKVSSAWEIFIKRMSGYPMLTTETDSFFSVCLFRSPKGDVHSEGYVLEVECCSSVNQLSDKKEIPDFIKKVSKKKKGGKTKTQYAFICTVITASSCVSLTIGICVHFVLLKPCARIWCFVILSIWRAIILIERNKFHHIIMKNVPSHRWYQLSYHCRRQSYNGINVLSWNNTCNFNFFVRIPCWIVL